jgi:proteasome lid subunit RPN8/RPN11
MADLGVPGLSARLRASIYEHTFANEDREVGGVLVGHFDDGDLPYVTASIAALEADGQRASVTFTHDAWATIHAKMDADYPGQQIVGWYHSHPGFGIFLSSFDEFIHQNFFSDRRQIAYVVDPHAGTEGVFHWKSGQLATLSEGATDIAGTHPKRTSRRTAHPSAPRTPPLRMTGGAATAFEASPQAITYQRLVMALVVVLVIALVVVVVITR